jgi:RNA polymerase-binding transcription factor
MAQYDHIRANLERQRTDLLARLEQLRQDLRRPNNPDFAEQATERENDEVLDALDGASRAELAAIGRALARIESGDYGTCAGCGEAIPIKRLEVLPFSVYCVNCADRQGAR